MKKKVVLMFWGNTILLIFLTAALFASSPVWGTISALCTVVLSAFCFHALRHQQQTFEQRLEQALIRANDTANSSTQQLLMELVLPCLVTDDKGTIQWFNLELGKLFPGVRLIGESVFKLLPECSELSELQEKAVLIRDVHWKDKIYSMIVQKLDGEFEARSITFLDVTRERELEQAYESSRIAAGNITVDNYTEVTSGLTDGEQNKLVMELEAALYRWAAPLEGFIRRIERDRFLLIVDQQHLNRLLEEKFTILNEVKKIKGHGGIPVTLSIGIGSRQTTVSEAVTAAQAALELALGRGGDQAVVKQEDQFFFFGGNSRELEKRTRVRARVVAQALYGLIENAPEVMIMGHKNPDADCIGAALGICAIARHLNTPARIVLGECNSSVKKMVSDLKKDVPPVWIEPAHARNFMRDNTLVVVVDIHRPSLVECPQLVEQSSHVVLIDHHRRSADFIERPVLMYQEPYASSTSEMVSEILQYIGNGMKLTRSEAEALLSGIVLDTKSFTVKTNVRTFDAASYLRRQGADPVKVQNMFRTDLETYRKIAEAVEAAEIYKKQYAITYCLPGKDDMQIMPMAADELLTIEGILASFVLCPHEGHVHVSARSRGEVNVQRVMEQTGGGGHQTAAGSQLEGFTLDQAKEKILQLIDEYEQN